MRHIDCYLWNEEYELLMDILNHANYDSEDSKVFNRMLELLQETKEYRPKTE